MYSGQVLKNDYAIGFYVDKDLNKIYCIEKIKKKIVKIKIDMSFYINKSIVMKIYNDITIKEIKSCVLNYLKNQFPFLNENVTISILSNEYLQDDKKLIFYNFSNKPLKLFLQPFNIENNNF